MAFWEKLEKETKKEVLKEKKQKSPQQEKEKIGIGIKKENWFEPEGELTIDAYQTENEIVIQSTIAGVNPEDLDIAIENEILTIKGVRKKPEIEEHSEGDKQKNYFYQECYWGPFSKEIMLSEEVDTSNVEATIKQGILTIRMPKIQRKNKRKIKVKG